MKDPWRPSVPIKPEAPQRPKNGERMNLGDDIDEDLHFENPVYFSVEGAGSICVAHKDDDTAGDALLRLATCLRALWDAGMHNDITNAYVRVRVGDRTFGLLETKPPLPITHSWQTEPDFEPPAALHFVNQTPRDGMVRLLRVLALARHSEKYASTLKKYGVRPMIR